MLTPAVIAILAFGATQIACQSSTSLSPAQITHFVTVANNLTATNGSAVFTPAVVNASLGETVIFNFTNGTHSATQSTFDVPCRPAHETNITINGFDTGLRPANNGSSRTDYRIIMNPDIADRPLWFYDEATCGIGGVGVINVGNVTATWQPYDAFVRNAIRLNGTGTATSSIPAPTRSSTSPGSSGSNSGGSGSGSGDTTSAAAAVYISTWGLTLGPLLLMALASA
ncbi:hypothetical protein MIND_00025800 [Mycena indigotica]|uniref:Extracellular serine-rich protein n=1 Tax=Mycena indigotica TaxID=2126181 RepID=A0A8H6TG37_9AGAR|nr:uncharacterized protein MIND_00025800 [Mycena indigotica]KAF7315115.1 hypothetical protein MIND_00025800 [Mycena indigotica]